MKTTDRAEDRANAARDTGRVGNPLGSSLLVGLIASVCCGGSVVNLETAEPRYNERRAHAQARG